MEKSSFLPTMHSHCFKMSSTFFVLLQFSDTMIPTSQHQQEHLSNPNHKHCTPMIECSCIKSRQKCFSTLPQNQDDQLIPTYQATHYSYVLKPHICCVTIIAMNRLQTKRSNYSSSQVLRFQNFHWNKSTQ